MWIIFFIVGFILLDSIVFYSIMRFKLFFTWEHRLKISKEKLLVLHFGFSTYAGSIGYSFNSSGMDWIFAFYVLRFRCIVGIEDVDLPF